MQSLHRSQFGKIERETTKKLQHKNGYRRKINSCASRELIAIFQKPSTDNILSELRTVTRLQLVNGRTGHRKRHGQS